MGPAPRNEIHEAIDGGEELRRPATEVEEVARRRQLEARQRGAGETERRREAEHRRHDQAALRGSDRLGGDGIGNERLEIELGQARFAARLPKRQAEIDRERPRFGDLPAPLRALGERGENGVVDQVFPTAAERLDDLLREALGELRHPFASVVSASRRRFRPR